MNIVPASPGMASFTPVEGEAVRGIVGKVSGLFVHALVGASVIAGVIVGLYVGFVCLDRHFRRKRWSVMMQGLSLLGGVDHTNQPTGEGDVLDAL